MGVARNDHSEYQQNQLVCAKYIFCSLIHDGRNEKILGQNIIIVTREEKSKVAFVSHYGKNPNRTAEKKQTNKQINKKQNKGPTKTISNFQEAAGNNRVLIRNKERKMSWSCTPRPSGLNDSVIHVPKELSGFVCTLLTGSIDSSEREYCQRVEHLIKSSSQDF